MLALRKFETVGGNGQVVIDIPQEFGQKVEILVLPVKENEVSNDIQTENYFLSMAFENDPEEDAIWEKYVTRNV